VPPGVDHKSAALSTPKIGLQEFKRKEDIFRAYYSHMEKQSKLNITVKHSQTEMGFVFHCRL